MTNPCFVLGNGPSLRGFDFAGLGDCATLGMNAAYRYWDEIDWYPTYFACLDDQLIITHHDEFYRLWKDGKIATFFLHGSFFDYHPDCIGADGFYTLDQVLPHWYGRRGKAQGWPALMDAPAFWTEDTTKVTTGAWAARFAAHMGHDLIALAGIDLQYVEVIPEAEQVEGIRLVMKETPKTNPNYFFDSYQRAGDKFNIPNPAQHDSALHIQSFQLVRSDFAKVNPGVQVVNTNPRSQLESDRVFPLRSAAAVLNAPKMAAVVVPATAVEIESILANFDIWADPDHAPITPDHDPALCTLHFVFNNSSAAVYEPMMRQVYSETRMERYFSHLKFTYLELTGDLDKYERNYANPVGDEGYKSGPNNQFFGAMAQAQDDGHTVFQMETDCVPLRAGWLSALQDLVADHDPFWVLGSRYLGVETLSPDFANHINGNAIYAVGDTGFQEFLRDFWEPHTRAMVAQKDKRLAYDCILETVFSTQKDSDPAVAAVLDTSGHLFGTTQYVLNISGKADLGTLSDSYSAGLLAKHPQAYVLHNRTAQQRAAKEIAQPRPLPTMAALLPVADLHIEMSATSMRLLVIDMTAMGNGSATGEIKTNLLREWGGADLLQIASPTAQALATVQRGADGTYVTIPGDTAGVQQAVADFAPEMILYRPLPDRPELHALAMTIVTTLDVPLVTWIMDDWPARLYANDREAFQRFDPDLRALLKQSVLRLSISQAMSRAYEDRYGLPFTAFANGIDPALWTAPKQHSAGPLIVRYAGGLAPDMNAASIQQVARAVQSLADEGRDIRFEINTQSWWMNQAKSLFQGLSATTITAERRSFAAYRDWLCGADALLVAYNFDAESLRYVRYSMANKLPECLASGAAILAYGPQGVATIDYLLQTKTGLVVDTPTQPALRTALTALMQPKTRQDMAAIGRKLVHLRHNLPVLARDLAASFDNARKPAPTVTPQMFMGAGDQPAGGVLIYDDPIAAVATALADGATMQEAVQNWQAAIQPMMTRMRKYRGQILVMQRRSDAVPSPQQLARLQQETNLDALPAAAAVALQPVDPVLRALAALVLQQDPNAAELVAELTASREPWDAEAMGKPIDLGLALTHFRHAKTQAAAPVVATPAAGQLQALQAQVARKQAELDHVYRSKSWRMTGKFRGLRARLGWIKQDLQRRMPKRG